MPVLLTAWKCNSWLGRVAPKALEHCGQHHQVQSGEVNCGQVELSVALWVQVGSGVAR